MENAVAIITARGGSKRIPRKNVKEFCGKPILAYSIEAALRSGLFETVMVSTDDKEIAEIAEKYGAKVPFFRSAQNANDYATTVDVLCEVLNQYKEQGKEFQYGCCIYPTAPFVTAEKLQQGMKLLQEEGTDSVMPVTAFSFPPMRGMYLQDNGSINYAFPEYAQKRSQDITEMYHDCGQFYFFKPDILMQKRSIVTEHTKAMTVPELEVQDIDNESDWEIAEIKYRFMEAK